MGRSTSSDSRMTRWVASPSATRAWATAWYFGAPRPASIKRLVSHVVSRSSGCQYCAAHTGFQATRSGGVSPEKIEAAFEYETSPLFSEDERAALRVAQSAAAVPNEVTDEDMDELKKHFSDRQIVELVGQISVFGFLNRWNDTMATELESLPTQYGNDHLAKYGWETGKHSAG